MKQTEARGLVLKEYETGESDKRLLLLCKEHGRVLAYARGARKPRSKFMASAQLFTYSDFVLTAGRGFFSVTQADVIESFYNLRTDYDRLCAAHLIAEVCEKTLLEANNCDDLLRLVLKSFSILAKGKFPPKQITAVFLLKFFDFYGLRPNTEFRKTTNLQKTADLPSPENFLFWGKEGIVSKNSNTGVQGNLIANISENLSTGVFENSGAGDVIKISDAAATAATFILNNELARSFSFEASENVLNELIKMSRLLWRSHFDRELRST